MKRIIISLGFMLGTFQLMAQQDPMYGQYMFNNAIINPAQAGVQDENQVGLLARRQWLGMDGAPTTNSLFINTKLPKNLGFAGGIYNDKIGPVKTLTFQADLAAHVQINDNWNFSGGIRTMLSNMSVNLTALQTSQTNDPNFANNLSSGNYLNMGAGVLVYSDKFFFGASLPRLFSSEVKDGNTIINKSQNHLYMYTGATFDINDEFTFKPSILFKRVSDAPVQFDYNLIFNYKQVLDVGPMLRSKDAIGFLAGYKVTPQVYVGYMYEYPINDMHLATNQTHELSIRMLWQTKHKTKIKSPRYFL